MNFRVSCLSVCLSLLASYASSTCFAQAPVSAPITPATEKSYSATGSMDGITFIVNRLKRNSNGTLTVSVRIQGTQGKPVRREAIGFSGDEPYNTHYKLLDLVNKKRYSMLEDSNGHCLCTHLTNEEVSDLSSGKPKDINIKFPMPPSDLLNITVELPNAEPIEDVPISN